jgi:hypothetical protein
MSRCRYRSRVGKTLWCGNVLEWERSWRMLVMFVKILGRTVAIYID